MKLFPNLEAALKGVFNRVLTELWLGGNDIGDVGAKAIAEALKVNAVLKFFRKTSTSFLREQKYRKNINDDIKGASFLARPPRTASPPASPPARVPARPVNLALCAMKSILYEYRLHRLHFP